MQRKWTFTFVATLLLVLVLSGCSGGPQPVAPEGCAPEISQETALAAQEKALAGALMGSIELNSSEWSSLATGLVQANSPNLPIEEVIICITPDGAYEKLVMTDGTVLEAIGETNVVDNRLAIGLQALSLNGQALTEPTLAAIEGAFNRAFDDPSLAVAGTIEYGEDVATITLGQ